MKQLILRKIFASQAKPKLYSTRSGPNLIWKTGDNLFADLSVMFMAHFANSLWKKANKKIKMQTYGIYPCGNDRGFIECVDNVCALREYKFSNLRCSKQFLGSLAGACLIGWVLGIRDRHQDNQLILTKSGKTLLVPIDFGFLFNSGPMIDAPRISFPNRMLDEMKKANKIKPFIQLTLSGYETLYDNQELVASLGEYLFPAQFSEYFNTKTFFHLEKAKAMESFENKLTKKCSGKGLKHQVKDIAHNFKISRS